MSRFRRFELIEEPSFCYSSSSPFFFTETLTSFPSFVDGVDLDLDLLLLPSPFDAVTDLVRTPSFAYRRVNRTESCLQSLCDRVAELESRFDRLVSGKSGGGGGDRKYTWTTEIKGAEKNGFDRKYKWVAEVVEEEKKKNKLKLAAKNVKFTAEIKGKGEDSGSSRKYTFEVESGGDAEKKKEKEKEKEKVKEKKKGSGLRIVEIQEPSGHRDVVLRQVW